MDTLRLALLEQMLVSVSSLLLQSVLMLQELLNAFGQFGCGQVFPGHWAKGWRQSDLGPVGLFLLVFQVIRGYQSELVYRAHLSGVC